MEQIVIDEAAVVPVDYEARDIPRSVQQFRPTLYKDGETYCCILGPDLQTGILGCGPTECEALVDWDANLKKRLRQHTADDEVAQFVTDTLAISKKDIW